MIIDCDTSLPTMGDLTKLRQVMINVVSNSLKFTQAGYVKLAASRRNLSQPIGKRREHVTTIRNTWQHFATGANTIRLIGWNPQP